MKHSKSKEDRLVVSYNNCQVLSNGSEPQTAKLLTSLDQGLDKEFDIRM